MFSTQVSRASAGLLLVAGLALLLVPDVVLPRLVPGFPAGGFWLGQLLAAALLALAVLDWLHRSALLGGIYGRPVVMSNAAFYFIAAMVLLRRMVGGDVPVALWIVAVPVVVLAAVYFWLLRRGPVERDLEMYRGSQIK